MQMQIQVNYYISGKLHKTKLNLSLEIVYRSILSGQPLIYFMRQQI